MIAAVALVPSPPFLLPEYAGRTDPDPVLRSACVEAVESVAAQVDRLVVICGSDPDRRHSGRSVGARVATELLPREADGVHEVPWDASVEACRSAGESLVVGEPRDLRLGLVVVADGCATRTEKAPGHLDRRSWRSTRRSRSSCGSGDGLPSRSWPEPCWRTAGIRPPRHTAPGWGIPSACVTWCSQRVEGRPPRRGRGGRGRPGGCANRPGPWGRSLSTGRRRRATWHRSGRAGR